MSENSGAKSESKVGLSPRAKVVFASVLLGVALSFGIARHSNFGLPVNTDLPQPSSPPTTIVEPNLGLQINPNLPSLLSTLTRVVESHDIIGSETSEIVTLEPNLCVADFFDLDKAIQRMVNKEFGESYSVVEAMQEMGVEDFSTIEGLLNGVPKTPEQEKLLMLKLLEAQYGGHGEGVYSVGQKVSSTIVENEEHYEPKRKSIAEAVRITKIEKDEIGNIIATVEISPEKVSQIVAQSSENIVNMSFAVGEFEFVYTLFKTEMVYPDELKKLGSTRTVNGVTTHTWANKGRTMSQEEYDEIQKKSQERIIVLKQPSDRSFQSIDGYIGSETYNNLLGLTQIARDNPKKLFFAAGGNPVEFKGTKYPDISEARQKLEEQGLWPENLLMIGVQGDSEIYVGPASYGADFYVSTDDLDRLGIPWSSSNATHFVSEIARMLVESGITDRSELLETLRLLTNEEYYWEGAEEEPYKVLDFERIKAIIDRMRSTGR